MKHKTRFLVTLIFSSLFFISCSQEEPKNESTSHDVKIIPVTEYNVNNLMVDKLKIMRKDKGIDVPLYEAYKNLPVIDVHNHSATGFPQTEFEKYGIDRTVLFGNISEPLAMSSDKLAWADYKQRPDLVYPSFAGINIYEESGITYAKEKLEQGYLNIGELVAASTYSHVTSQLVWKGDNPLSGNLDEVYKLAATYKVPVLLHIDPPSGAPIQFLERALVNHPETNIIFGHANVYNDPKDIERLLSKHPNLYIDFYAGFTEYDTGSSYKIKDYIPLIEKYPNQFLFGTDSGFGITYQSAVNAIYQTIDLLSPETAVKVAYQNYEKLIELQPPTNKQKEKIQELINKLNIANESYTLNKRMANELIFDLEIQLSKKQKKDKQ